MTEKYYQLGTHTAEQWCEIHHELMSEEGGDARVGYQDITKITQSTFPIRRARISSGLTLNNLKIDYKGKLDRC